MSGIHDHASSLSSNAECCLIYGCNAACARSRNRAIMGPVLPQSGVPCPTPNTYPLLQWRVRCWRGNPTHQQEDHQQKYPTGNETGYCHLFILGDNTPIPVAPPVGGALIYMSASISTSFPVPNYNEWPWPDFTL